MASYVYGNTVRKEAIAPQRAIEQPKKKSQQEQRKQKKALHMSIGYVVFLVFAATIAVFACVQYLHLQSEIADRSANITSMQLKLERAKEENTTRYNAVQNSMNLEQIREKAMTDLGMVYAEEGQVIEYENPSKELVTQYAEIPESGIIASSGETE